MDQVDHKEPGVFEAHQEPVEQPDPGDQQDPRDLGVNLGCAEAPAQTDRTEAGDRLAQLDPGVNRDLQEPPGLQERLVVWVNPDHKEPAEHLDCLDPPENRDHQDLMDRMDPEELRCVSDTHFANLKREFKNAATQLNLPPVSLLEMSLYRTF